MFPHIFSFSPRCTDFRTLRSRSSETYRRKNQKKKTNILTSTTRVSDFSYIRMLHKTTRSRIAETFALLYPNIRIDRKVKTKLIASKHQWTWRDHPEYKTMRMTIDLQFGVCTNVYRTGRIRTTVCQRGNTFYDLSKNKIYYDRRDTNSKIDTRKVFGPIIIIINSITRLLSVVNTIYPSSNARYYGFER